MKVTERCERCKINCHKAIVNFLSYFFTVTRIYIYKIVRTSNRNLFNFVFSIILFSGCEIYIYITIRVDRSLSRIIFPPDEHCVESESYSRYSVTCNPIETKKILLSRAIRKNFKSQINSDPSIHRVPPLFQPLPPPRARAQTRLYEPSPYKTNITIM